jgi:RND family efflux transporter MFP subunit
MTDRKEKMSNCLPKGWAVFALSLFIVSCAEEESAPLKPRVVKTFQVSEPSETYQRSFSGQLKASEGTGIGFQVNGRILDLDVKVGSRIEAEEVLARLDDSDYQNQLADANAKLSQARKELQRTRLLFEAENASQSQIDSATARSLSAEAAAELAARRVTDCVLKMPYTGLIGEVRAEKQQVVSAGQVIVTIQGEEGLEFEIGVPADLVGAIENGQIASIEVGGKDDLVYSGEVTEISPQVAENTTYPVVITIDQADGQIRAGMDEVAIVELPSGTASLMLIPFECVVAQADNDPFVWVVEVLGNGLGKLGRQVVVLGSLAADGMIGVVSGLETGDVIVSRGVHRVEAGMEVLVDLEPSVAE